MSYINFNNAGSSKPYPGVNEAINNYLKAEKKYGGYYAAHLFEKKIDLIYKNLSKLIKCKEGEISFLQSATVAWNLFLNSIKINKKQNIVILDNEYGSNFIYLKNKGFRIKIVKIKKNGMVCFDDLMKKIDENTRVVCVCHIASQCGDIIEAGKIGDLVKQKNSETFYIVDACQSVGQIEVNVKKLKCDALVGSGRKYLRGPRGTGFIFLSNKIRDKIKPPLLDLKNAKWDGHKIKINKNRIYENFEHSVALKIGLGKALDKLNIKKVAKDIRNKSIILRRKLRNFKNIIFFENIERISGINTFCIDGIKTDHVYNYLMSKKILCSLSTLETSSLYFSKKKTNKLLRISLHEYNTIKEINYLVKCLIDLTKK